MKDWLTIPKIEIFKYGKIEEYHNIQVSPSIETHHSIEEAKTIGNIIDSGLPSFPTLVSIIIEADKLAEQGNELAKGLLNDIIFGKETTGTFMDANTIIHLDNIIGRIIYETEFSLGVPWSMTEELEKNMKHYQKLTGQKDPRELSRVLKKFGKNLYQGHDDLQLVFTNPHLGRDGYRIRPLSIDGRTCKIQENTYSGWFNLEFSGAGSERYRIVRKETD